MKINLIFMISMFVYSILVAAYTEPEVYYLSRNCHEFFQDLTRYETAITQVSGGTVFIGSYVDLPRLLSQAKAESRSSAAIMDISRAIKEGRFSGSVLPQTLKALDDSVTRKDLSIFALTSDATILHYNNPAFFMTPAMQIQFGIVSHDIFVNSDALLAAHVKPYENRRQDFSVIYVKGQTLTPTDPDDVMGIIGRPEIGFFHEAAHYADSWLIKKWMQANIRLNLKNKSTDRLFQAFTRRIGSYWVLSEAFVNFFTEPRAHWVTWQLHVGLDHISDVNDIARKRMYSAHVIVTHLNAIHGAPVLKYFNLSDDPSLYLTDPHLVERFYELAVGKNNLGDELQRTIESAKK